MKYSVQNQLSAYDDSFLLYEKIRNSGYSPQITIGIARGGQTPARLIADFLHLKQTGNIKAEACQMVGKEDIDPR